MSLEIVTYFANARNGGYGDIYTSMGDLKKDHPDAEMLTGWGAGDTATGYSPDDAADWYWTRTDAQASSTRKRARGARRSRRWMPLT